jgi:hypothetical protein
MEEEQRIGGTVREKQLPQPPQRPELQRRLLRAAIALLLTYLIAAYIIVPLVWKRETRHQLDPSGVPRLTHTPSGIHGDPVNVALLGAESNVIRAMTAAKWYPADPITFRSSLRIAVDSVFRRPDDDAPVSSLELFGRKQDLAFEQPVGDSPRKRHHVRYWHWDRLDDGIEVWFGAATFDERVGLSDTTGQITHHIGGDVDSERDKILSDLKRAGHTTEIYWLDGFHTQLQGKNGGGDWWHTDGRLGVAVLTTSLNAPAVTNYPGLP